MKRTVTIPATFISIALGVIIALAGSQGSELYNGVALFAICASVSYLLHWIIFIPSYIYQTEHNFDLTGSISYLSAIGLGFFLNPSMDPRDLLIGVLIVIWAVRLGTFLFSRVKQDGKDGRFTIMKTQFHWYIMTWTLGGLWVFLTMAAGLAAITSNVNIPLGVMAYLGLALWILGFSIEVIADKQKRDFKKQQLVTLISPIFVYVLLTRISGIPMLENRGMKKWGSDPEYIDYLERTPSLLLKKPNK